MSKRLVAKIYNGEWRIYDKDGRFWVYHEFYDGKWHTKQFESGRSFDTLEEALHQLATYMENDKFIRRLASRFTHE